MALSGVAAGDHLFSFSFTFLADAVTEPPS